MKAKETNFLELMQNQAHQYIVPIYQRTYSWGEKQCQVLWEDVLSISKKKDEDRHFIGSIVCFNACMINLPGALNKEIIIDGQQRITTISLLMIAIIRTYEKIGKSEIANSIMKKSIINNDYQDEEKYKLLLTNQDRETYKALVDGLENEIKEPSVALMDSYNLFISLLDDNEKMCEDVYKGLQKLDIVYIGLDSKSDNPQLIFESMNSTGLKLTQGDLLRNYLLLDLEVKEQEDLYKRFWLPIENDFGIEGYKDKFDYFIRDYLIMKEEKTQIRLDGGYDEYKEYFADSELTKEKALEDLRRFSKYYSKIYKCNDEDEELNELWKELKIQRVDVANPFLMQLYNDYEQSKNDDSINLSKDDFMEIVRAINSYVYRRYICGIPTNSLNKTFALLGKDINKDEYRDNILASLLLMDNYKEFPTDDRFISAFKEKDIYNSRLRKYTLAKLENNYHPKAKMNLDGNDDVTIEHVLPENKNLNAYWKEKLGADWQELQKKYLHTIGNLTFSNRAYNSEMQDYSFEEKLKIDGGIKYSNYRLSDDVANSEKWDIEEIKKLTEKRAKEALEIWKRPTLSDEKLKKYSNIIKKENHYYENMEHYTKMRKEINDKYDELDRRILELDSNIIKVYTKCYVAYKYDYNNFIEIIIYKNSVDIVMDMEFESIMDEKGICKNITSMGKWGTGNIQVKVKEDADIEYIMSLIKQSFENIKLESVE